MRRLEELTAEELEPLRHEFEGLYAQHYSDHMHADWTAVEIESMREGQSYASRPYLNGCWSGFLLANGVLPK